MNKLTMKEFKQVLRAHGALSQTLELSKLLGFLVDLIEKQQEQIEVLEDKVDILAEEAKVNFF